MVLCGALKPELLSELVENWGAGRTETTPVFATSRFRWLRFPSDPRGIPIPAEPRFTTRRDGDNGEATGPPFPTTTVFATPVGATGALKWTSVVLV